MKKYMLEVKDISYKIGKNEILKGINFNVENGEIVGIIGPNGSGKTTLLKCLNGIIDEISGNILFKQKNINDYTEKELAQNIVFMNQNTNLGFDFPCLDVVVLGRYPYLNYFENYSKSDYEKAKFYMNETKTLEFQNRLITELSGGERQRVLFAKALAQEGELILLDEPSSSLDMGYEEDMFKLISKLKDKQKSVIAVIHNLRVAVKYCTRLILISDGKIVDDGRVEKVLTEQNLKDVYGVNTRVYQNSYNKELDFCLY